MIYGMVIAATAIKVASATEDGAICQVEPEILPHVTPGALPATDREKEISSCKVVQGEGQGGAGGQARPLLEIPSPPGPLFLSPRVPPCLVQASLPPASCGWWPLGPREE